MELSFAGDNDLTKARFVSCALRWSLETTEPWRTTETATLYLGLRLWAGAEIYASPEASGGKALSGAVGIAGFPNGEATRVGNQS